MIGDVLLCYLKGDKKLIGALKVTGKPFFAKEPRIWKSQEFPARLPVAPILTLDPANAVNLTNVLPQLSFYDSTNVKRTFARFQGSPTKLPDADGELMFAAIQDAATKAAADTLTFPGQEGAPPAGEPAAVDDA